MTTIVDKLSYDQKEIIGRGGNGTTVFSGSILEGGDEGDINIIKKKVAIKRIQRSYAQDDESTIKREVELMLKVGHHPNILRYIHSEMDINYIYIATELCIGTLEDFFNGKYDGLEKGIITKTQILRQVTKGLAHLHKLGIVHRDIKPTNILIFEPSLEVSSNKPQMKLADFDISKVLKTDGEDFTNTSVTNPSGTWGWIAPEAYQSKRFDFKVDVWALGCIFGYTLSGGKHPYGDDDVIERINRIKQKRAILLTKKDFLMDENSENVKIVFEFIKSLLIVDPKFRPTVFDVLKNPFLRDGERTAQFLGICESFKDSITNEKILQFKELIKDETVHVNAITTTKDDAKVTPLHLVCRYCHEKDTLIECAKDLLSSSADVNAKTKYGSTPLHYLCKYYTEDNLLDLVKIFIENGADITAKDENESTLLHYLGQHYLKDNLLDVVKLFIEKGADVNAKDSSKRTPLHLLCYYYHNKNLALVMRLLLEKGAQVNVQEKTERDSPLSLVCSNYKRENLLDIVELLIKNGADVNNNFVTYGRWRRPLCLLLRENYDNVNLIRIVQLFVANGAIMILLDTDGRTPLHYLCRNYTKSNLKEMAQIFIQLGSVVNHSDKFGSTPLHFLCSNNENDNVKDTVELLIQKGAPVNVIDKSGSTALHYLCSYYEKDNLKDTVQLLIQKGALVNVKNQNGETPFHQLCSNYKREDLFDIVQLLIEKGADFNDKNSNESTPLLLLCEKQFNYDTLMEVAQLLIHKGADVNVKDKDGSTPLHLLLYHAENHVDMAQKDGLMSLISLFVEKGDNINAKNKDGKTPFGILRERGIWDLS